MHHLDCKGCSYVCEQTTIKSQKCSSTALQDSLRTYDRDGDNRLNRDEFVDFARSLVNTGALPLRNSSAATAL